MTEINQLYVELSEAYDRFNADLFGNTLPDCVLTLTRAKRCYGFFAPRAYRSRGGEVAPEIALNPEHFIDRDAIEIYSTLVHEMCHYYQMIFGSPSRNGYHNKEFADIMERVGLMASDSGEPGGKKTGQKMSHYVIEDGAFALSYASFHANLIGKWGAMADMKEVRKSESKVKYTCGECGQNAWAKPGAMLLCGVCTLESGDPVEMVSAYLL